MEKRRFGDVLREARQEKGLSLRQLAEQAGLDYSRLAKIEAGSRPAPDLMSMRTLAEVLELDLAGLIVSAGTSREVVENLVWSERLALGAEDSVHAAYVPDREGEIQRNRFVVTVLERQGGRCRVKLGRDRLTVFSFSEDPWLDVEFPPEAVVVFLADPSAVLGSDENVLSVTAKKVRRLGPLLDLVLTGSGYELNAMVGREQIEMAGISGGERIFVFVPPAAVRTSPVES